MEPEKTEQPAAQFLDSAENGGPSGIECAVMLAVIIVATIAAISSLGDKKPEAKDAAAP